MENYIKIYSTAEAVWNSSDSTPSERAEAFRKQRAMILASTKDPDKQAALLKKHYQKLESKLGMHKQQHSESVPKPIKIEPNSDDELRSQSPLNGNAAAPTSSPPSSSNDQFRTASEELRRQQVQKTRGPRVPSTSFFNYGATKKPKSVAAPFKPPFAEEEGTKKKSNGNHASTAAADSTAPSDDRLANIEPKMIELITNEIMHKCTSVDWNDIAGLINAKGIIQEAVCLPLLRPDLFTGLRGPPRGILLFGPPGTGKTLIGKCIAAQSGATFFTISASSLTSKWVGEGEKMVRALFAVAAVHKPSVIFIDEIDSLLSKRSETEHESSRRLKTEFLVQLDGAATVNDERVLVVAATNRPQELDEAARRRFEKRLYVPLPEQEARGQILQKLLRSVRHNLSATQTEEISALTGGYSGADMNSLCREAAMRPIRSIPLAEMRDFPAEKVRPVNAEDFHAALQSVRPSVCQDDLQQYIEWNRLYGATA